MEKYSNFENLINELESFFEKKQEITPEEWNHMIRKYKKDDGDTPSKNYVINYIKQSRKQISPKIIEHIQMKPTRSISGVVPITIFTKPYKCSGDCIFCPNSKDAPKSYLPEEPGIQRAITFKYDPYEQVKGRIKAVDAIGHNTSKIELIISGGTWDDYDLNYRIWYMLEVYRALNEEDSCKYHPDQNYNTEENLDILKKLQKANQDSKHKSVGICIETRPDRINIENIKWYRKFGFTKIQIGVQSLNRKILESNNRMHSLEDIYNGLDLLRKAGFKIHIHWMPNLYKSDPQLDYLDFKEVFQNKHVKPDEIKIYPCSILPNTQLSQLYEKGLYEPYTYEELLELLSKCKKYIPNYCRINRLIRDIPSSSILEGNKITNLRQHVQENMYKKGLKCKCIRCREIKNKKYEKLELKITDYQTHVSTEHFLEYVTPDNKIAGFTRLSIYKDGTSLLIDTKAMIREVHIYGMSLNLQKKSQLSNQHLGLGTKLLLKAEEIVKSKDIDKISVISAIGTKEYYRKRGYVEEDEYGYLTKNLK